MSQQLSTRTTKQVENSKCWGSKHSPGACRTLDLETAAFAALLPHIHSSKSIYFSLPRENEMTFKRAKTSPEWNIYACQLWRAALLCHELTAFLQCLAKCLVLTAWVQWKGIQEKGWSFYSHSISCLLWLTSKCLVCKVNSSVAQSFVHIPFTEEKRALFTQ